MSILTMVAVTLCLWMSPTGAWAQLLGLPGGGDLPVIDKSNLEVNSTTATNTGETATNTGTLVEQGWINLGPAPAYPRHDILQLVKLINEVLATGSAVHYQLDDIPGVFSQTYSGFSFTEIQDWWDFMGRLSPSSLDTLLGTLNTVHEQLKPTEWALDQILTEELNLAITNPEQGNLSITQVQGMTTLALIEELRKGRQLAGANINAQNMAQAHHINLQMYGERVTHDYLEASVIPVVAYSGRTGY